MNTTSESIHVLQGTLDLPCGAILNNRMHSHQCRIRMLMMELGRSMALKPRLADTWLSESGPDPASPKLESIPPGGITAWYPMRLTTLGEDRKNTFKMDLPTAIREYEERDAKRCIKCKKKFTH